MAWAINGTPDTLTGVGDDVTISDQTPTNFNIVMAHILDSGNISTLSRFGNGSIDSGSNYAERVTFNGAADATAVNQTDITLLSAGFGGAVNVFHIQYFMNIATEEKLLISFAGTDDGGGTGVAPQRAEAYGKWVDTTNQTDHVQIINGQPGDFAIDSNISALGA